MEVLSKITGEMEAAGGTVIGKPTRIGPGAAVREKSPLESRAETGPDFKIERGIVVLGIGIGIGIGVSELIRGTDPTPGPAIRNVLRMEARVAEAEAGSAVGAVDVTVSARESGRGKEARRKIVGVAKAAVFGAVEYVSVKARAGAGVAEAGARVEARVCFPGRKTAATMAAVAATAARASIPRSAVPPAQLKERSTQAT